ncbi:HlyD family efflux transporter periplasmic adaptor subunit [Sphingobacterium thalpophilum]|uniref:Hemolysin secretion protein D, chromosomal n=1 Tax=Sphingobacterium thalpophilum TaxID=259 RepID=A0A4U9VPN2_9SPHI|nr:HlyD family efflux transporter periplasmic adaptor subunit [Sphingobacterium thalpophilum]VTR49296.1 Hemolysin secretion protein D, chromosomal [Sphingobacterium thalpophilum]
MSATEEKNDLHSEDVTDIIYSPPSWLLKRGTALVLLIFTTIICFSMFIKYPDIIMNQLRITTDNDPKPVVNRIAGNISQILIRDGQKVAMGQALAYMESASNHEDVLKLLSQVASIEDVNKVEISKLANLVDPSNLRLGELQDAYQNFYQAYLTYLAVKEGGGALRQRKILEEDIKNVKLQNIQNQRSLELIKEEIKIAEEEIEKYRILAKRKVISPMELKKQEATFLGKLKALPQSENNILNNYSVTLAQEKELSELDNKIEENKKSFVQAFNKFKSEGESWKLRYVLFSPIKGKVMYETSLQEKQFLPINQTVFYVYTENEKYFGEMSIRQSNFGKIKTGQSVMIKVHGYPYEEFGYLHGKIKQISAIPFRDSIFLSKVEIFRTPKDSRIILKPGVFANAEVITDEQTVFFRLWKSIFKTLNPY